MVHHNEDNKELAVILPDIRYPEKILAGYLAESHPVQPRMKHCKYTIKNQSKKD